MEELYFIIHDNSKDIYTKIDEQIDKFWKWSKNQKQVKEWEPNYELWTLIYTLISKLFENSEYKDWDRKTINNLLYIIGRDNECEEIIDQLTRKPSILYPLAEEALNYHDNDTRWQFAHYLGRITQKEPRAKELIVKFSEDYVEYVRRRALAALETIA
ncbi:HEAT repeat domain-containing protein [Paenibacillus sp. N3.4]|uniref:HEAT repeat domain-containing protein n=1 Tax=Paenibacillus sp. N3.4 TaxID=2603222 RepID=UPI0011C72F0F|nr:HEAT repeat domain-containing protein [Paenibacillus sp. N3.4]TXK80681.1 HEAT repeat domain-containing protein [Paenibacillus sp. N3.4]